MNAAIRPSPFASEAMSLMGSSPSRRRRRRRRRRSERPDADGRIGTGRVIGAPAGSACARRRRPRRSFGSNIGVGPLRTIVASFLLTAVLLLIGSTSNNAGAAIRGGLHVPLFVEATNANPSRFVLEQPDGTESPPVLLTGSPHYHQMEDETGYTVLADPADGYLKYGAVDPGSGEVVPTAHKLGAVDETSGEVIDPAKLGLEKKVVPTEEAIAKKCGQFCIDEQESKEGWEPPVPKPRCRGLLCRIYGGGSSSGSGTPRSGTSTTSSTSKTGSSSTNKKVGLLESLSGGNRYLRGYLNQMLHDGHDINNDQEDIHAEQVAATRQLQAERAKRRRKLAAVQGGKLVNVVIPIQFADHPDSSLPSIEHIATLFNAVNGHQTICPTGSIRDVFFQSSYGKLTVVSQVVPWIKLSRPQSYYAGGKSGMAPQFQEALVEALEALEADPNFSFADFDANGDGLIDAITYVHSGFGAEWGGVDCTTAKAGVGDRIWSHKWRLSPQTWTSPREGVLVEEYHISPALHGKLLVCSVDLCELTSMAVHVCPMGGGKPIRSHTPSPFSFVLYTDMHISPTFRSVWDGDGAHWNNRA